MPESVESSDNSCYLHHASYQQLAIWQASKIAQEPALYNLLYPITLNGEVDVQQLNRAITAVINHHDALRSCFFWQDGALKVKVVEPSQTNVTLFALEGEAVASIDAIGQQFGAMPYDLSEGPLYRFKLVRTAATQLVLLCGFHHLVIDGTTIKRFVSELLARLANPINLAKSRTQYIDYCQWQQAQSKTQCWNEAIDYWGNTLNRQHEQLSFSPDNIASKRSGNLAGVYQQRMSSEDVGLLNTVSAKLNVSPFRIAFAAFFVFLNQLSKHDALSVATTLTGCSNPRFNQLIGLFVNIAIVQLKVQKELSFAHLVHLLDRQVDQLVSMQDYPHYLANQQALSKHEVGANALATVSFTKLPTQQYHHFPEFDATDEVKHLEYADRDLSVYMQKLGEDIELTWQFRSAVFTAAAIDGYAQQFAMVLHTLLKQVETPISKLSFVSPSDRHKILVEWNNNNREYANLKSVHALFEEQVARTPNAIAVVTPEHQITYQALNNQANQLALSLFSQGVHAGCYVPVLIKSSHTLLIAELAVMKCGAAFCPIAPDWPQPRIHNILEQLNAQVVLAESVDDVQHIDSQYQTLFVTYQDHIANIDNLNVTVALDSAVYCIFTSGTTGVPKGAVNHYRGILNRLRFMDNQFHADLAHVVLATAPAYVDTHFWQYFWPLINGGSVVIPTKQDSVIPEKVIRYIRQYAVTFMDFVPTVFKRIVHYLASNPEDRASLNTLKHVIIGGEAMSADMVNQFRTLFPAVDVWNSYGPTETSIGIIFYEIQDKVVNPVPLGRPIPNVKTVILDEDLNLVPIGSTGELYVGGVCVGLGYLNDQEATQRKFIANPFSELNCATLYRTGDLAQYQPSGDIQYLGRVDNQIKVHGIRMEPEEIETVIKRHPLIDEAVIRLRKNSAKPPHLVAYITSSAQDHLIDALGISAFLKQALPRQMVPSVFIKLLCMPLSQNGKIDRLALDNAVGQVLKSEKPFKAPTSNLELSLAQAWQSVLNQREVSIDDDFFDDLGGDSFSALLFIEHYAKAHQKEIDIRLLYESSTIAKLATRLNEAATVKQVEMLANAKTQISHDFGQVLTAQRSYIKTWKGKQISEDSFLFMLNGNGSKPPLFWCFQGYHEFSQLAEHLGEDQPLVGMRSGHLIMEYTPANLEAIALNYVTEMIEIFPVGEFLVGGNCQGGRIAFVIAKCLARLGRTVKQLIMMEQSIFETYDGNVALIFGDASKYNPYLSHRDPATFLSTYYGNFTIDLTTGGHGEFFSDVNIHSLSNIIKTKIAH